MAPVSILYPEILGERRARELAPTRVIVWRHSRDVGEVDGRQRRDAKCYNIAERILTNLDATPYEYAQTIFIGEV